MSLQSRFLFWNTIQLCTGITWLILCHLLRTGGWKLIHENAYTLTLIHVNNIVLCFCLRSLLSSASNHEAGRGSCKLASRIKPQILHNSWQAPPKAKIWVVFFIFLFWYETSLKMYFKKLKKNSCLNARHRMISSHQLELYWYISKWNE